MAANPDYEQAGELKFGQVGIANLRVRTLDPTRLAEEMADRVRRAPKLFARAAVVVDFGGLSQCPDAGQTRALLDALRGAGGIRHDPGEFVQQAAQAAPAPEAAPAPAPAARAEPGLVHLHPVRSGQQVYAQDRDLTLCATVGAGAEVIADGSIHVYGALRGRALAGASGVTSARIFCREFHAELVAVAGHYKVLEEIPKELLGKPVQIWLEHDKLRIEQLG